LLDSSTLLVASLRLGTLPCIIFPGNSAIPENLARIRTPGRSGGIYFHQATHPLTIFRTADTMDGPQPDRGNGDLPVKIARLVEERGWNQEDFARIANLNRHTVRTILKKGDKKLRNATISQCAAALGLHVNELRTLSLERLLPRMHGKALPEEEGGLKLLHESATMPELKSWLERNLDRAAQISQSEAEELLAMEGANGPLAKVGVEHCVELLERRRRIMSQVKTISMTEYIDLLEQMIGLIHDRVTSPRAAT
jgi:transcriptional regulator with XRE-family HTH domain